MLIGWFYFRLMYSTSTHINKYIHTHLLSLKKIEKKICINGFNLELNVWSWMNIEHTDRSQSAGLFCMQFDIHHVYWSECSECTNYLLFSFPMDFHFQFFFSLFFGLLVEIFVFILHVSHFHHSSQSGEHFYLSIGFCWFFFCLVFYFWEFEIDKPHEWYRVECGTHISKGPRTCIVMNSI